MARILIIDDHPHMKDLLSGELLDEGHQLLTLTAYDPFLEDPRVAQADGYIVKSFIHLDRIKALEPFGLDVFQTHFDLLKGQSMELVFTGKNADTLAPDKPSLFGLSISTISDAHNHG